MRLVGFHTLLIGAIVTASCAAQAQTRDNSAVDMNRAPDRDEQLVAKAKQEGTLTFYTSLATTESIPLTQAFEKKYGIKVNLWRGLSENVLQRTVAEARAQRPTVDVVETNGPEVEALAREKILAEFFSPHLAELRDWAVPAHHLWASDRVDLWVAGYNTNKVKREEIPKTLEGFLDPKWQGRLALEATDDDWMAAIIKDMGEEKGIAFFRKLAAMKPEMRKGHILLAQLIGAGEIPLGLTVYSGNADSIKAKGGPMDWVPVEPVAGRMQAIGLARNALHPNAALLFADFVLSPEGAEMLNSFGRVPSNRKVDTVLDHVHSVLADPTVSSDEAKKWQKLWSELFLH